MSQVFVKSKKNKYKRGIRSRRNEEIGLTHAKGEKQEVYELTQEV